MNRAIAGAIGALVLTLGALPAATLADTPPPAAAVTISDTGLSPRSVTVIAGGSVSFTNSGNSVHTATAVPGTLAGFDSGGLGHGQAATAGFGTPGTFSYTSAPDCLNGNATPGFDCGPYTVVVVLPGQASSGQAPASSNVAVSIDDATGFQPGTLTVQAGQTVVWTNRGTKVHTATIDGGYFPGFDSGGINPGQSFSYTFSSPGVFTYHSATEPVYYPDPNAGNAQTVNYQFRGTVTVQSPGGLQPAPTAVPAPPPPTQYPFGIKEVTTPPLACGNGNRVPCVASAPNAGTQYVQGHVLDAAGHGLAGYTVQANSSAGGGIMSSTTDADGLFTIVLYNQGLFVYCPSYVTPRIVKLWLTDPQGSLVSDQKTLSYQDCNVAGEFHFDFIKLT
jgi:plastocyanin